MVAANERTLNLVECILNCEYTEIRGKRKGGDGGNGADMMVVLVVVATSVALKFHKRLRYK